MTITKTEEPMTTKTTAKILVTPLGHDGSAPWWPDPRPVLPVGPRASAWLVAIVGELFAHAREIRTLPGYDAATPAAVLAANNVQLVLSVAALGADYLVGSGMDAGSAAFFSRFAVEHDDRDECARARDEFLRLPLSAQRAALQTITRQLEQLGGAVSLRRELLRKVDGALAVVESWLEADRTR